MVTRSWCDNADKGLAIFEKSSPLSNQDAIQLLGPAQQRGIVQFSRSILLGGEDVDVPQAERLGYGTGMWTSMKKAGLT
jgi:hypothetical protein